MSTLVRRANLEDVPWIVDELEKFAKFYETHHSLFPGEKHAAEQLSMIITNHVAFVSEYNGNRAGFIIGVLFNHTFNPKIRILSESFWWVADKYRGTRVGLVLLDEFVKTGRGLADMITFALETKSPVKDRCLEKRGFHLHERNYLLEVT